MKARVNSGTEVENNDEMRHVNSITNFFSSIMPAAAAMFLLFARLARGTRADCTNILEDESTRRIPGNRSTTRTREP